MFRECLENVQRMFRECLENQSNLNFIKYVQRIKAIFREYLKKAFVPKEYLENIQRILEKVQRIIKKKELIPRLLHVKLRNYNYFDTI